MDSKWREILEKVERGELTPEEGASEMAKAAQQIPASTAGPAGLPAPEEPAGMPFAEDPSNGRSSAERATDPEVIEDFESVYAFWRSWWILPLSVGALIFVAGAVLVAWGNQPGQAFWLFCGLLPLLLGLGVMFASFWSRSARWLHIRIRKNGEGHPTRIAISMPIPIQWIGWGMKTFGHLIPGLREQPEVTASIPEILHALEKSGDPLVVEVNEKNGNEVRIYIM